jgi:hypothetical protein
MYRMNRFEFIQYEIAEKRLEELEQEHAAELEHAYDEISPTLTYFDYDLGRIVSSSTNPEKYAIYLVELSEKHEKKEKYWRDRAAVYQEAVKALSEEERKHLEQPGIHRGKYNPLRKKMLDRVSAIVAQRTDLQRKPIQSVEPVEEYDRRIDNMSENELLADYWDKEQTTSL